MDFLGRKVQNSNVQTECLIHISININNAKKDAALKNTEETNHTVCIQSVYIGVIHRDETMLQIFEVCTRLITISVCV